MLKYALNNRCPWNAYSVCMGAAKAGDLDMFRETMSMDEHHFAGRDDGRRE